MKKPTEEELKITHDVLAWYLKYLQEYEPYVIHTIRALETVEESLPFDADELEDADG